jgi:hypothetical protein
MRVGVSRIAPVAAVAVSAWLAAPASAFYFPGWPGSGEPKTPTIVPPTTPTEGNLPSAKPPIDTPPPEGELPPGGPSSVPEPTTVTAALIGLAAVGARAYAKRSRKKK